ncbi:MAG TPA: hypothetical protein VMB27_19535 [Solirubrobacteraceae bacterium]|nr:hypothetical protein [Solirubrobacteraceae bacterium]
MKAVVMVLLVEAIPIGVLVGAVFPRLQLDPALAGPPRRRRSRFWLRLAGIVIAIWVPALVALVAPLGEQTAGPLLLAGLPWGILLVALSRFVLFDGPGLDPGSADGDDEGPGPDGDGRPTPPAPIGGIPLLDAEPFSTRVRDHRPPRRGLRPHRPVRQQERLGSRLWPVRPLSSWRAIRART